MPLLAFSSPPTGRGSSPAQRGTPRISPLTRSLTRGVCRMLTGMGYGTLTEFPLPNGRRVDVIGLGTQGTFAIVEIKSTVEDFRADRKWHEYLPFCEHFYFAVPQRFPIAVLPADCGVIVADRYDGTILRPSPAAVVNGTRKRRQLQRFAHAASMRLQALCDPPL